MSKHDVLSSPQHTASVAPLTAVAHTLKLLSRQFASPLLFSAMLLAFATGAQAVTDTLTASGTWTAPAGVTSVDVEIWGGGGAGGGNPDKSDGGGGGGGGAYARTTSIPVVPNTVYTVTVGTGGTGGTGTGGAGGDSWFINTTTILAKGGGGGREPASGAGGSGGAGGTAAASVGTTKFSGGNGGTGLNDKDGRGGPGGSSAGTAANGTSGDAVWTTAIAAAPPAGGGIGGGGGNANRADGLAPASGNGGGGGGGAENMTSGGAGAPGLVKITYTLSTTFVAEYRMDSSSWNGTVGEVVDTIAGNNGTGMGGVTTTPSLGVGKGICNVGVFDGANDYIAIPTLFNQLRGTFTLSAWLNTTQLGNNVDWQAPGITGVEQSGGQDDIFLGWLDAVGHIGFNVKNDTSFLSSSVVNNGAWHHVAFTRNMTTGVTQIYVDGVLEGTRTQPTGLVGNSFDGIGRISNTGTTLPIYFTGKLDEYKVFASVLSGAAISTGYNNEKAGKNWDGSARTCASLLNHVSIDAPTTAMAFSTVPVVLSPHTAAHVALTGHTIKLSTSTGRGDWNIGTGIGTLTPGTANSGQATYTFGAGESAASLYFVYQSADTVNIYVTDSGNVDLLTNTPIVELSNTITYTLPDYVFTNSPCVHNIAFGAPGQTCAVLSWSPQVAGIDVANIYITTLKGGIPTRLHPTLVRTRDMAFGLSCHNPAANAGIQATFAGVTLPLCQANGATPATWSASTLTASFSGGSPSTGPYSFNYADVGKVELWMRDSAVTTQVGASGQFVVAPHHLGITAVTAGPIKAGSDFSAKVTVYNGLSTPTATPNFGKEITPENVTLSFTKCQPSGTSSSAGSFSSGTIPSFTSGATTPTALNWSEVGNGDLTATLSGGSYLLSGLSATGNTSASGTVCKDGTGTAIAGTVGAFVPHHFNTYVTAPMTVCPTGQTCPVAGWAYSGQTFTVNVSAANASDAITLNYDGTPNTSPNFAQAATLEAWDAAGSTTTQNPPATAAGALSNTAIPAASFIRGSTILGTPATPAYTFATSPTAPTDIYLRAADANATSRRSVAGTSIEGGLKIVSGRFKIGNNYGSELIPLAMTTTVQFYGGANWLTSTTDSATSFNSALSTAGGNVVVSNIVGLGGTVIINAPSAAAVTTGTRTFTVNAPGVAGSADFTLNAPAYLLTGSNGAAVDPSTPGRATFGIYSGNDAFIYQREAY